MNEERGNIRAWATLRHYFTIIPGQTEVNEEDLLDYPAFGQGIENGTLEN
jgi:hypothetical protein